MRVEPEIVWVLERERVCGRNLREDSPPSRSAQATKTHSHCDAKNKNGCVGIPSKLRPPSSLFHLIFHLILD